MKEGSRSPGSLPHGVWTLVFELMRTQDLFNICLVSKTWNALATKFLYRSIPIGEQHSHITHSQIWSNEASIRSRLLSRLEDDSNDELRAFVQEVAVMPTFAYTIRSISELEVEDWLCKLFVRLPNLQLVSIHTSIQRLDEIICTICDHNRRPELRLFSVNGTMGDSRLADRTLSCISTLHATVNPFKEQDGPNRHILHLQKLFFKCPNMRSFSLCVHGNYGGCVLNFPSFDTIRTFQLAGYENFPLIEELSLDAYAMEDDEWIHWKDRFSWSKLKSLTLGPSDPCNLLDRMAGYATSLRTLKVLGYAEEGNSDCKSVERFLFSFDSLETLELNGYLCSVNAVAQHKNISDLCLHMAEYSEKEIQRRVLTTAELKHLDKHCPKMESLSIDVERSNNEWPESIFGSLATSFANLKALSIHFELGISDIENPIMPALDESWAKNLSQKFFNKRHSFDYVKDDNDRTSLGKLHTLTLKTGESQRRFPQWEPEYSRWENQQSATYETSLLGDSSVDIRITRAPLY
ncbi:hypothetical protein BGW36DRAFT_461495 [Talaromyces proteolyticus]|uniref:F-box domain-containing protein n=1 Tax=Talaromyces proteolyticus TaxID=1131652 RepID=A0AAD4KPK8_9EURO|nr:uncharacterized protein BGW36DRAFT_461495 [Talaromyces proteolyticus]KAH8697537.1 hypothetical protein BGW36DRAFT_461495 [Talaromyces proteolyticus]